MAPGRLGRAVTATGTMADRRANVKIVHKSRAWKGIRTALLLKWIHQSEHVYGHLSYHSPLGWEGEAWKKMTQGGMRKLVWGMLEKVRGSRKGGKESKRIHFSSFATSLVWRLGFYFQGFHVFVAICFKILGGKLMFTGLKIFLLYFSL